MSVGVIIPSLLFLGRLSLLCRVVEARLETRSVAAVCATGEVGIELFLEGKLSPEIFVLLEVILHLEVNACGRSSQHLYS
jgi:hypothetical protein